MLKLSDLDKKQFEEKIKNIKSTNKKIETLLFEYLSNYLGKSKKNLREVNVKEAFNSLFIANDMWYIAVDKATDYNFYTKRLILSAIIGKIYFKIQTNNKFCEEKLKVEIENEIQKVGKFNQIKSKILSFACNPLKKEIFKKNSRGY